jgi:hypothetical protein
MKTDKTEKPTPDSTGDSSASLASCGYLRPVSAVAPKPGKGRIRKEVSTSVRTDTGAAICTTTYGPYDDATAERIAKRIVACWNRCLHLSDAELSVR